MLEILNRTYPSPKKLHLMGVASPPPRVCPLCDLIADSPHLITDCILPQCFLLNWARFCKFKKFPSIFFDETFFEFSFRLPLKTANFQIQTQLFLLFSSIKKASFSLYLDPDFAQLSYIKCWAKTQTAAKLAVESAKINRIPNALISDYSDFLCADEIDFATDFQNHISRAMYG